MVSGLGLRFAACVMSDIGVTLGCVVRGTRWARESVWQVQGASATRFFLRAAEEGGDASDLPRKKLRPSSVLTCIEF
jgi:hypothetical protein